MKACKQKDLPDDLKFDPSIDAPPRKRGIIGDINSIRFEDLGYKDDGLGIGHRSVLPYYVNRSIETGIKANIALGQIYKVNKKLVDMTEYIDDEVKQYRIATRTLRHTNYLPKELISEYEDGTPFSVRSMVNITDPDGWKEFYTGDELEGIDDETCRSMRLISFNISKTFIFDEDYEKTVVLPELERTTKRIITEYEERKTGVVKRKLTGMDAAIHYDEKAALAKIYPDMSYDEAKLKYREDKRKEMIDEHEAMSQYHRDTENFYRKNIGIIEDEFEAFRMFCFNDGTIHKYAELPMWKKVFVNSCLLHESLRDEHNKLIYDYNNGDPSIIAQINKELNDERTKKK